MKIFAVSRFVKSDGKVFFLFENEKVLPIRGLAVAKDVFLAKTGETQVFRAKETIIFASLGKKEEFEPERLRVAAGAALQAAKKAAGNLFFVAIPKIPVSDAQAARLIAEGALLSDYEFSRYRTKKDEGQEKTVEFFIAGKSAKAVSSGLESGQTLAKATNYARDVNNEPPNVASAEFLANKAKELARNHGMKVTVLGIDELSRMGLHGIEAVSSASKTPGRLVVLEYGEGNEPFVFIGKGITFDSGGVSIKPSKDMEKMRWDKSGACAVLGILKAAADLKIKGKIIGVIPLAENMPAGFGYRPGDILRTGGKSVEIINTDAEGRVILSDAISWVRENVKRPKAVIDIATLTGACVTALGSYASGLFGNDEKLLKEIFAAGEKTGERVWQLPLWQEYEQMIKGKHGDIKNIGEPSEAGAITAAWFLKEFVGEWPWAHIDIAGTAYQTGPYAKNYMGWGATGAGVRICAQYLLDRAK